MRARWAALTRDTPLLPKAYSLDAVAEELLFVTGPLLVGLAVAVVHPAFALLGTAAVSITGTLLMTRQAGSAVAATRPDAATPAPTGRCGNPASARCW